MLTETANRPARRNIHRLAILALAGGLVADPVVQRPAQRLSVVRPQEPRGGGITEAEHGGPVTDEHAVEARAPQQSLADFHREAARITGRTNFGRHQLLDGPGHPPGRR